MTQDKQMKMVFGPGVLESLAESMTETEQQEFIDMLQAQMENGTLLDNSTPVDMDKLRTEDPMEYEMLMATLDNLDEGENWIDHRTLN